MTIVDIRRNALRELIRRRFDGVARRLAAAAAKPEGQINDMLAPAPRKSFGEKIARQMEQTLGLESGYFDNVANTCPSGQIINLGVEQPTANYLAGTIGEILAILERLGDNEQKEALGAVRYIEYEFNQRQQNSTQRAGQ